MVRPGGLMKHVALGSSAVLIALVLAAPAAAAQSRARGTAPVEGQAVPRRAPRGESQPPAPSPEARRSQPPSVSAPPPGAPPTQPQAPRAEAPRASVAAPR